jgi:cytidine deaminase
MKKKEVNTTIWECQKEELSQKEQALVDQAIEATQRAYAPYSKFRVGAALLLDNGVTISGCNQENAATPAGLCAERSAIFAAGAQFPGVGVKTIVIAARGTDGELLKEPISPCGICRQVIVETETRYQREVRILLYGTRFIYVIDGIKSLMPLSFTEF